MRRRASLPSKALTLHASRPVRAVQSGHPDSGFGGDLQRHHRLPILKTTRPTRGLGTMHGYQPSIHVVTCSVALAMCFSTVLMLNPWRCAITW